jgi:hypothetical protein
VDDFRNGAGIASYSVVEWQVNGGSLQEVNMGANGFDRIADGQAACSGRRLAWLIIPAPKVNWQLPVANGRLISDPSCRTLPVGSIGAPISRLSCAGLVRAVAVKLHRNSRVGSLSFGVRQGENPKWSD